MSHEVNAKKLLPVLQAMRLYHRHSVVGMENIPDTGRALVVVNHSLATYDIMLLMAAIYTEKNRLPRPLIDRLFFKIPVIKDLSTMCGAVQGSQEGAESLLQEDHIVTVAPGGMREALRPSTERYQLRWDRRMGFIRLAMRTRTPIILAACPKADDLYEVYPNLLTSIIYKNFRVPVFLARGFGLSPLPKPIRLVHFLSEPILPPEIPGDEGEFRKISEDFHRLIVSEMTSLMNKGIHHRGR